MAGSVEERATLGRQTQRASVFPPRALLGVALLGVALLGVALLGAALGCSSPTPLPTPPLPPTPPPTSLVRPGLLQLGRAIIDYRSGASPHLGEVAVADGAFFVANSFNGVAAFAVDASGAVSLVTEQRYAPTTPRCTTIALHPPSGTLFCSAGDRRGPLPAVEQVTAVTSYDAVRPQALVVRDLAALRTDLFVASLHVMGDYLLLAAFERGLWQAPILAGGALGAPVRLPFADDAVGVASSGELVVVLDRDAGLRLGRRSGVDVVAQGRAAALAGPALHVSVEGTRASVALGSEGAQLFELGEQGPRPIASVRPRCAVVSSALRGDAWAVVCISGLYLYELSGGEPRLRAYFPAQTAMLGAGFVGEHLVVSDWGAASAFRMDLGGQVVCADPPRGLRTGRGGALTLPVHNPAEAQLRVDVDLVSERGLTTVAIARDVAIAPGGSAQFSLPAETLRTGVEGGSFVARVWTREAAEVAPTLGALTPCGGDPGGATSTEVLVRGDVLLMPEGPAAGEPFPALTADPGGEPATVPLAGVRQLLIFVEDSCVALWPELQDLAWHLGTDGAVSGVVPLLISNQNDEFRQRWRLQGLRRFLRADAATLYDARYAMQRLPGPWHTEFLVDEQGIVRRTQRIYPGIAGTLADLP